MQIMFKEKMDELELNAKAYDYVASIHQVHGVGMHLTLSVRQIYY